MEKLKETATDKEENKEPIWRSTRVSSDQVNYSRATLRLELANPDAFLKKSDAVGAIHRIVRWQAKRLHPFCDINIRLEYKAEDGGGIRTIPLEWMTVASGINNYLLSKVRPREWRPELYLRDTMGPGSGLLSGNAVLKSYGAGAKLHAIEITVTSRSLSHGEGICRRRAMEIAEGIEVMLENKSGFTLDEHERILEGMAIGATILFAGASLMNLLRGDIGAAAATSVSAGSCALITTVLSMRRKMEFNWAMESLAPPASSD